MQAGVTGINAMRVYSATKQAKDQDPEGTFIRRFVPELAGVPLGRLCEPWRMDVDEQMRAGVMVVPRATLASRAGGAGLAYYPLPIVDEAQSARAAKERLGEIRRQGATKLEASAVLKKHGSRKPAGAGGKRKRAPAPASAAGKGGAKDKQRLITAFTGK